MGCSSCTPKRDRKTHRPSYFQHKKAFMKLEKVQHFEKIQELAKFAKQVIEFNKDPEKVNRNIQKFNEVEDVLGGNDITQPIADCVK